MPDSLPPPGWGLAPFDDRDLDAVLAGMTADIPVALRPVVDVLAALRAGPAPAELYGEAGAMAEFRALGLGQAERPAGSAPTMPLEALPEQGQARARPGRQPARHRARPGRRHALWRSTLRPSVLFTVAAAAVIVFAVVLTGNFVGPLRDIAHMARPSAGTSSATGSTGRSSAPRVETTSAAKEPAGGPSVGHSAAPPTPGDICRAYFTGLRYPWPSAWVTQESLREQLTKLARSDNWLKVYRYCFQYVKDLFPGITPAAGQNQAPPAPGRAGPGDQNTGYLGSQSGGAAAGSRTGSVSSG